MELQRYFLKVVLLFTLVVVVYPVAVSTQDYALLDLLVCFSEPSVRYKTVHVVLFSTRIFVVEV